MKNINIMTACNEGYAKLILPQLVSMHKNLGEYKVNFFLLYNRITPETINLIKTFSDTLENVEFFPCYVDKDIEKYNALASSGATGNRIYPYETYFLLGCQNYLPEWVDRALYIHSADVIFLEDISDFYFSSFNGKTLTVEVSAPRIVKKFKDGQPIFYSAEDRAEFVRTKKLKTAYFNEGTFMVNVGKFREKNHSMDYYLNIRDEIISYLPEITNGIYYPGGQDFFGIAFLGDINNYQEIIHDLIHLREYNYSPIVKKSRVHHQRSEVKNPKIIHYDDRFKPWNLEPDFFKDGISARINEGNYIRGLHGFGPIVFQEFYQMYWEFAKETPLYDELLKEAILLSSWTKKTYMRAINSDIYHRNKVLQLEMEIEKYSELEMENREKVSELEMKIQKYSELEMKIKNYKEALQRLLD